jgi:hypothetical protein
MHGGELIPIVLFTESFDELTGAAWCVQEINIRHINIYHRANLIIDFSLMYIFMMETIQIKMSTIKTSVKNGVQRSENLSEYKIKTESPAYFAKKFIYINCIQNTIIVNFAPY